MAAAPNISVTEPKTSDPGTSQDKPFLGEELLKSYPGLSKFKTPEDLGKSYGELEKSRGNAVTIPGADAKPEEWDAYYNKAGRPEKADGYKVERPKIEGLESYPEDVEKDFLGAAHKAGLNNQQTQALLNWWGGREGANLKSITDAEGKGAADLQKAWGDSFNENLGLARTAAKNLLGDDSKDLSELLKTTGMDRHPAVVKFFHKLAVQTGEKGVVDPKVKVEEGHVDVAKADLARSRAEYDALKPADRRNRAKEFSTKWEGFYKVINAESD